MDQSLNFDNYKNIELDPSISPCDLCVLDNDNILLTNYKERNMVLFDKNFQKIKTINKLKSMDTTINEPNQNEETIGSVCVDINDTHDFLYISDYNNHKVLKCDLDFNQVNVTDGNIDSKFKHPFGICFYNNSVYVCDCSNKRIQKLNASNLQFEAVFNLVDFKPWRIKIGNNVACVRATITNPSINFYNLETFQLLVSYNDHNGIIGFYNSKFYEFYGPTKKIYCYNSTNGELENEIDTGGLGLGNITSRNGAFILFNGNIIIGSHDSQKLCIIKAF
jgi:hypothetical protein